MAAELGMGEPVGSADEVFDTIAEAIPTFRGLSYGRLGVRGAVLPAGEGAEVTA